MSSIKTANSFHLHIQHATILINLFNVQVCNDAWDLLRIDQTFCPFFSHLGCAYECVWVCMCL